MTDSVVNMRKLIEVSDLCWRVDGKLVLDKINFSINEGNFVGLLGPNGAGKSSLMRCFYGANKPQGGSIEYEQQDLLKLHPKKRAREIAVILQEHSPFLALKVEEIVTLGLTPHKGLFERETKQDKALIESTLVKLDLHEMRHETYAHLSGGEKQRVMLAKAIVQNPKLLIMDEPTNHLDVHYQIELLTLVKKLGKTVLASFHDLNLAMAYCDYLLIIDHGKINILGSPSDIMSEDLVSSVFNTCALVDKHPLYSHPRISYAYHNDPN